MGRLETERISADDIMILTSGGLDVFRKELTDFSTTKNIKNPFLSKDNNPSARIKQSQKSGLWLLHVYNGEGGYYTAITFIQKKYNLSFNEAIDYILDGRELTPIVKDSYKIAKKTPILYEFEAFLEYPKEHCKYYCKNLGQDFLMKEMDIYAVKKYAINKHVKYPERGTCIFAYEHKDIEGVSTGKVKFLTVGSKVDKKDKWRNNISPTEFFYTYKLKRDNPKICFISKSNKDAAITQKLGITSLAVLSENRNNIETGLVKLLPLFPDTQFVLNMGSDQQGFETSYYLSKKFNLSWFNTKKKFLLNGINDNFAYVEAFGIKNFEKELKEKGYL